MFEHINYETTININLSAGKGEGKGGLGQVSNHRPDT